MPERQVVGWFEIAGGWVANMPQPTTVAMHCLRLPVALIRLIFSAFTPLLNQRPPLMSLIPV